MLLMLLMVYRVVGLIKRVVQTARIEIDVHHTARLLSTQLAPSYASPRVIFAAILLCKTVVLLLKV